MVHFSILKRLFIRIYLVPYQLFSLAFLRRKKMIIVTGADSKFYYSMLQLINSIHIHEKGKYQIIAYDLGLTDNEINFFKWRFPGIELKKLDFSKYPQHADINKNSGGYAWKPQIIFNEFTVNDSIPFIFWLDAGCIVRSQLLLIRAALYFYGFYSAVSGPLIKELTHKNTISLLNLERESNCKMLTAGVIGFNKRSDKNNMLLSEWANAARNPEIICPPGSSKDNHRYDQSIVSMLFYKIYKIKNQPIISKKGLEIITQKYIG